MIRLDPELVLAARDGSRSALDSLVRSLQRPVFNLAIRMLGDAADAEDAAQEILVQVITHLGDIRDPQAAGAWAFRLACRHLVHTGKRGRLEAQRLTFRAFAADLGDGVEELPDEAATDPETQAMVEEVKVGCTLALLTCLSRPLRAAYVLGETFELSDQEAASALEIDPAAFRQRLKRARALVEAFMRARCGLVSPEAACRCDRRVAQAVRLGRVEKGRRMLADPDHAGARMVKVRAGIAEIERGREAAALMRSNPDFVTEIGERVLAALDCDGRSIGRCDSTPTPTDKAASSPSRRRRG
jgi:RNA polymerase sigma factor (sigma-70 family)